MADNRNIIFSVTAKTGESKRTIAELEKVLRDLLKTYKALQVGSAEQISTGKQITATKSELKDASKELNQILAKENNSLGGVNEAAKFAAGSLGELRQEQKRLRAEIQRNPLDSKETKEYAEQLKVVNAKIKDFNDSLKENERAAKAAAKAEQDAAKATAKLAAEQDKAAKEAKDVANANNEANRILQKEDATINELTQAFKNLKKAQGDNAFGSQQFKDAAENLDALKGKLVEAGARGESLTGVLQKGFTNLSGQVVGLGAGLVGAFAVDKLIQYGGELLEVTNQFNKLKISIGQVSGLAGEQLTEATAKISTTAKLLGESTEKTLLSVNSIAKQLGISFKDANALLRESFKQGGNVQGELLDISREYTGLLKDAGFTAKEIFSLVTQSQLSGAFSDKSIDLLKEFGNTMKNAEDRVKLADIATQSFGKTFSDKLFSDVNKGKIGTKEAFEQIITELNKLNKAGKDVRPTINAIFKSQGEDTSVQDVLTLNAAFDNTKNISKEVKEQLDANEIATENLELAYASLSDALGSTTTDFEVLRKQVTAGLIQGFAKFVEVLIQLPKWLKENRALFVALGAAIIGFNYTAIAASVGTLVSSFVAMRSAISAATIAQRALNLVMSLNPIGLVITAVGALVAALLYLYDNVVEVRAVFDGLGGFLVEFGKGILGYITNQFKGLYNIIVGLATSDFSQVKKGVGNLISSYTSLYDGVIGGAKKASKNFSETMKEGNEAVVKDNKKAGDKLNDQTKKAADARAKAQVAAATKANNEELAAAKKLQEEIAALRKRSDKAFASLTLTRIEQLKAETDAEIDELRKSAAFKALTVAQQEALILEIRRKYTDESIKLARETQQKELDELTKFFDDLTATRTKAIADEQQKVQAETDRANQQTAQAQEIDFLRRSKAIQVHNNYTAELAFQETERQKAEQIQRIYNETKTQADILFLRGETARKEADLQERANAIQVEAINTAFENEKRAIEAGFAKIIATNGVLSKAQADEQAKQIEAAQKTLNERLENQRTKFSNIQEQTKKTQDEIQKDADANSTKEVAAQKEQADLLDKKVLQIRKVQAALADVSDGLDKFSDIVSNITDAFTAGIVARAQAAQKASEEAIQKSTENIARLEEAEKSATGRRQALLRKELDEEKKRLKERNEALKKAQEEQAAAERRAAEIKKVLALAKIAIDTAQAIVAAIAANPATVGLPQSAIIAAQGVAQLAAVASQQFARGGIIEGSSHAQGGIPALAGGRLVNIEGDEIILTKGVARNPAKRAIASMLNVSEGGVRFAQGGIPRMAAGGPVQIADILSGRGGNEEVVNELKAIRAAYEAAPSPVVSVEAIDKAKQKVVRVQSIGY